MTKTTVKIVWCVWWGFAKLLMQCSLSSNYDVSVFMPTATEQSFTVFAEEIGSIPARESRDVKDAGASLSVRERTIVRLMGDGLSNKRIARQLSIAPETVKSHAKSIFLKLTVQSRAQAVYRAATLGLI